MISVWNVRGLNAFEKQQDVANFVNNYSRIGIFGMLETKLPVAKLKLCYQKYFTRFESIDTSAFHPRCRVWLLWDKTQYDLLSSVVEDSFIHVKVRHNFLQREFWMTVIYAPNDYAGRLLWESLAALKTSDP